MDWICALLSGRLESGHYRWNFACKSIRARVYTYRCYYVSPFHLPDPTELLKGVARNRNVRSTIRVTPFHSLEIFYYPYYLFILSSVVCRILSFSFLFFFSFGANDVYFNIYVSLLFLINHRFRIVQ